MCCAAGGGGGCNKVSLVFCVLSGGGGAVIKFPLLLCMCTLLVWFGGAVVGGSRFRLLWGVGVG